MSKIGRLAYDKKIQSYSNAVKESLNRIKEAVVADQKVAVSKAMFSESKEEGSDDSEELLEGETPAHPAMLFGHQDNIQVFENPSMEVVDFEDNDFLEDEINELEAELSDEDWAGFDE